MYRPQAAYPPAPPGWQDEDFEYYFDVSSLPAFQIALTPGQEITGLVLKLQPDAEFRLRALQVWNPNGALGVRFQTPDGQYFDADYVPASVFWGLPLATGGIPGGVPVAIEPEIVCPAGSALLLDLKNLA
jgi:hypothetical protein